MPHCEAVCVPPSVLVVECELTASASVKFSTIIGPGRQIHHDFGLNQPILQSSLKAAKPVLNCRIAFFSCMHLPSLALFDLRLPELHGSKFIEMTSSYANILRKLLVLQNSQTCTSQEKVWDQIFFRNSFPSGENAF